MGEGRATFACRTAQPIFRGDQMPFIKTTTDEQRLLANRRIDENGCWVWTGYVKKPSVKKRYLPYGYMHVGSRTNGTARARRVQRVAASLWLGLDLARSDLHVLNKCDNPRCFNPDHLFFGDNAANVADRHLKGRSRGRTSREKLWPSV